MECNPPPLFSGGVHLEGRLGRRVGHQVGVSQSSLFVIDLVPLVDVVVVVVIVENWTRPQWWIVSVAVGEQGRNRRGLPRLMVSTMSLFVLRFVRLVVAPVYLSKILSMSVDAYWKSFRAN